MSNEKKIIKREYNEDTGKFEDVEYKVKSATVVTTLTDAVPVVQTAIEQNMGLPPKDLAVAIVGALDRESMINQSLMG